MKTLGCLVEHKYCGIIAICDEDMLDDNDWVLF